MANFKVKNGLQAVRYLLSGGTETAGSEGYDLGAASYDSVSLDVSGQTILPLDVFFKPDGTKMYTIGASGSTYAVNEYTISTAWDISTSSYVQQFSVAGQETSPRGLWFSDDGTKMFVSGATGDDVNEYILSTAWDISTSSFVDSFSVASQDTAPTGLTFSADGTEMYVLGLVQDDVIQYTLTTAFDVSSASYTRNLIITTVEPNPRDVQFNSDGTVMFISGKTNGLHKYTLTTGYDISTATFNSSSTITPTSQPEPWGFFVKSDGTKVWVGDGTNKVIYQYSTVASTQTLDLSTGTTFSFTPSGATTVSFTNAPASGKAIGFSVEINGDGSAITWPISVKWHEGVAPTATASKEVYAFVTTDGGTVYYGRKAVEILA